MNYSRPQIIPKASVNWDDMSADFAGQSNIWREVSEEFAENMLGCVPPIYARGVQGFMVGEPWSDDEQGRTVYLGVVEVAGKRYARLLARQDFGQAYADLCRAVGQSLEVTP